MSLFSSQLIRSDIQSIASYHVADATGLVKLDAMENPYEIPLDLRNEWLRVLETVALNRYPDPAAEAVKQALASEISLPEGYDLLLGNGSDEIIQMLMLATAKPDASILAPEPGFVMYKMVAKWCGLEYLGVPLSADFSLDIAAMLSVIQTKQPELIFLAFPNNPTGNCFAKTDLQQIIEAAEGLVVIDEAYAPFAAESCVDFLAKCDNVVLMRTLSKFGLAGVRLGYLAGEATLLAELDKVRMPYNINVLTQASVAFLLQHKAIFAEQASAIKEQRNWVVAAIDALANEKSINVYVYPSEANFVLVKFADLDVKKIFSELKDAGILIKCLHGGHPLLENCLRITIGKSEENEQLIDALKAIL